MLLAAVMAHAVAAGGAGAAATLEAATSHSVSLVALLLAPSRLPLKKLGDALRAGGAELEAAYPELAALEAALPLLRDGAALAAHVGALPPAVTSRPDFARGLVAAVLDAAKDEGTDAAALGAAVAAAGDAIRAAVAAAGDATAAGAFVLSGVQALTASVFAQGMAEEGFTLAALQALQPVLPASAFHAWLAADVEPYGRQAAVEAAKAWVATL
jgi:hypothetical protein